MRIQLVILQSIVAFFIVKTANAETVTAPVSPRESQISATQTQADTTKLRPFQVAKLEQTTLSSLRLMPETKVEIALTIGVVPKQVAGPGANPCTDLNSIDCARKILRSNSVPGQFAAVSIPIDGPENLSTAAVDFLCKASLPGVEKQIYQQTANSVLALVRAARLARVNYRVPASIASLNYSHRIARLEIRHQFVFVGEELFAAVMVSDISGDRPVNLGEISLTPVIARRETVHDYISQAYAGLAADLPKSVEPR